MSYRLRKNILCGSLLGALMLSVTACTTSPNSQVTAVAENFDIHYEEAAAGQIVTATWTHEGEPYELCLTGIPGTLDDETITDILTAFYQGKTFKYVDEGLVDAEKCSNKLSGYTGTWVYEDEYREDPSWGDSLLCWAASTSDMLTLSGWKDKAVDEAGNPLFATEDDLFQMYVENFWNNGGYQRFGIQYFFEGQCSGETYPRENTGKGYITGLTYSDYVHYSDYNTVEEDYVPLDTIVQSLEALKAGGAAGCCVTMNSIYYPLKNDPDTLVSWDPDRNAYVDFGYVSDDRYADALTEHFYTFSEDGSYIFLEQSGEKYVDEAGREYDPLAVLSGYFVVKEDGTILLAEENWGEYSVMDCIAYETEEVDLEKPEVTALLGNGLHAITITGYIRKTSEDGASGVKALFIADSDNDGAVYTLTGDNLDRTGRVNSYTLYPTELYTASPDGDSLNLIDYEKDHITLITGLTVLDKAVFDAFCNDVGISSSSAIEQYDIYERRYSGSEFYLYWQAQDKKTLKRINQLIKDAERNHS